LAALPAGKNPGWVGPRAIWTFLENRKLSCPCRVQIPDRPAHSLVTIPNTLSWLTSLLCVFVCIDISSKINGLLTSKYYRKKDGVVRFEVLTTVLLKIQVFSGMYCCVTVYSFCHFEQIQWLQNVRYNLSNDTA
jgi:hypothetical protein